MIPQRPLGNTGLNVSLLGLGTVKIGRNQGVKYPTAFDLPTDTEVLGLLDCARELGINLIDTAPAYGISESRLGELLPNRQDWVLCTKVGESFSAANGSTYDFRASSIEQSVRQSLRELRTDYLDLVLIHSNGDDLEILNTFGALDVLAHLKQQGHIRAIGLSHKTLAGAQRAIELGADVIMATLNAQYQLEVGVINEAGVAGCGVLIKKALASGHTPPNEQAAALQAVAATPGVSSLVVGTLNPSHLRANALALS